MRTRHQTTARLVLWVGVLLGAATLRADSPAPLLAHLQFDIIGVRLVVDPPALTVPKNLATQINTSLALPAGIGAEARDAILTLTDGAQVEAELRGPSLQPTRIAVVPGQPIPIPPLAIPGDYFLDGIRLVKDGQTVLDATSSDGKPATTIPIRVINEVLVASVTSQPLSLDDIRSKGIVIDEKNFSAVNFQVAFNIDGTPFTISAPAVLPTPQLLQTSPDRTTLIQQISTLNQQLSAALTTLPPQFDRPGLNFSIAAMPFFPVDAGDGNDRGFSTPPITGLIVIPGNVAFLNQFFSALLMVANVAPSGTPLELHDVSGTITLPKGLDGVAGTFDQPGDDPLRLARIEGVGVQPTIAIAQRGPDGKLGTADDIFIIPPQKQGEGEFLIEGLKEGSHLFDIAIKATLFGLPQGPVDLEGQAAGAVFVRNPTFAVTLAHPRTVRSGEPYNIYATITNTSRSPANLVSVNLDPRAITGAQLLSDPTVTFDSIPAGQSVVAKYSMKAQLTGQVTFSSFTGDAALGGGIRLETGIDERGVPLSANAIVLPQSTEFLPDALVEAAQRVLGQAFSVATAPAEALPDGVLFVKRQTVIDRGVELAEAGERVKFGEPLSRVVQDLLLDWLGNTTADDGFDQIMRTTDAGNALLNAFSAVIGPDVVAAGALDYQRQFAQATVSRPGYLSAVATGPPGTSAPVLTIERESGGDINLDAEGHPFSTLETGVLLSPASGGGRLAIVGSPPADRYTVEVDASAPGSIDLGIVVPAGPAALQQLRFGGVTLAAGGTVRVVVDLTGGGVPQLTIDANGDGVPDGTRVPDVVPLTAGAPQLLAVRQLESSSREATPDMSDPAAYGLLIGALFDSPVTEESAERQANYAIASNQVIGAQLQHGGRIVYLYLQKPIGGLTPRSLTVNGVMDQHGNAVAASTQPITTILSDGAHLFGQVRDAGGSGVGGGILKLTYFSQFNDSFDVSAFRTDLNGGFDFDFIPRFGDHFTLTAQHPVTSDLTTITARVRAVGEQILLNPTFLGRGIVRGRVLAPDGVTAVPSVPIALIPGSVLGDRGFQVTTNALGQFTFNDVPVGVFTLSASDGLGAFGQADGLIASGGDLVTQDLVLVTQPQEGGRLIGRVFQSDGVTPGSGFTVYVGTYKRSKGTMAAVDQTSTDATGSFAFSRALPPGAYDVVVVDPATQQIGTTSAGIVARTTTSVSVVLESVGAVEGVVFNGRGERVAGAVVAGGIALVTTDGNGLFRIEGVPAGTRTIEAGDPVTKRRGSATVTVLPGQTASAAITLESRATITGRVLDPNGNPVPGASVRIPAVDGFTFVIANSQGVYTFPDMPLADYLLQAPGPSKESLIDFMEQNGIDPRTAFTSGDAPDGLTDPAEPPPASDTNAVLAAYQQAVTNFMTVPDTLLTGLPMASLGGFGWNKVSLFQDATTSVADITFLQQGAVSGTTVDSAARPTGAAVRISSLKVGETGFAEFGELQRLNTDPATGVFSFGGVARFDLATFQTAGVQAGDFTLEAATPFSPVHPQFRGQLSTATPNAAGIQLQFPAAVDTNGTVSGQVFMPDGATPVPAGTQVAINFGNLTVTTDAQGKFQSLLPIPFGSYVITVQTLSGLKGQTTALVPAGGNVDVQMRVLGLGATTITVTRPNGAAVFNAQVSLLRATFPADQASGTTDANGRVRFVSITEGPFSVMAQENVTGLSGRASAAIVRDADVAVPIVITASGAVTGTFLSATNTAPIAFAQVVLVSGGVQAYASTDVNGRFGLSAIPIGAFTVEGFDPLTNRRGRATGALQAEGQSVDVTIVEAARGTVAGFVVNADGVGAIPAARVSLSASTFVQTELQATALTDGSFRFEGVPAGVFTLKATDPVSGFSGTATGTVTFEGELVDKNIALTPFGSVHVKVQDVAGQPVSNASLAITGDCGECPARNGAVDANGEFTFEHLPLATYRIVARSLADTNNGGDTTVKIESANQVSDAAVRFRGVGSVTVTVVPSSGTGVVPSAAVTLSAQASSGGAPPGPLATTLSGFTDASGTVTFGSVPVGDFSVRAEAAALAGIATGSVASPAANVAVQVQLGASGIVAGRLLLPDGLIPAAGAFVTLRFQSQSSLQSGVLQVTTGLTGEFEFRGIPLGSFSLSAIEVVSHGVRSAAGTIASDGQRIDLGTLVLDNASPRIISVSPADHSTNVATRPSIVVTFSEPIASDSLSVADPGGNISLLEGSTTVPLTNPVFSTDRTSITVQPGRDLTSGALLSLTVKGAPDGPKDDAGLGMVDPFLSTFTVRDSIPPTVVSVSPGAGTVQASLDSVARVTFSEPVGTATVVLRDNGNVLVPGTVAVTLGGTVAVFAPTDFLRANTTYTVTVSNTVDLGGNPLVGGSFSSSFATVDTVAPTIAQLQVTGVPRVGATISVHPTIADTDVQRVEYSLGTVFVRAVTQVPFDAAIALPGDATSAVISAVAFDQVGNRSNPFTLPITIQANQPPLVTLTNLSGVTTVDQGQLLNFNVHATDDDQVAQIFFTAVGSASVSTIQQVTPAAGDVTRAFSFTVPAGAPSGSTITVQAAATDNSGAQGVPSAVTFTLHDAIKPTLTVLSPVNNAIVVPGSSVDVTVDAADDVALASVALVCNPSLAGCEARALGPAAASSRQTFTVVLPASLLAPQTLSLSIVATDTSGNQTLAGRVLQVADTVKPVLSALEPVSGSTRVVPGDTAVLRATVSDNVGVTALVFSTDGGLTTSGTGPISPAVVSGTANLSITIPSSVPNGSTVTVHVRARDAVNNLSDEALLTFTVGDSSPPVLTLLEPSDGGTVAPGGSITIRAHATDDVAVRRFSVVVTGVVTLTDSHDIVPATTPADTTFTVPVPSGTPAGQIVLTVTSTDTAGNSSDVVTRTLTVPDTVAPLVQITSPAPDAILDPRNPIAVGVSATDAVGVTSMSFAASGSASASETRPVAPAATSHSETFTVTVSPPPATGGPITFSASARDAAGNVGIASTVSIRVADVVAPDVVSVVPANSATNVDPFTQVVVRFSEPMNPATLINGSVRLLNGVTPVPASVVVGGSDDQVTLTPNVQPLPFNTVFTVAVSTAATDAAGNAVASAHSFTFTTLPPSTTPPQVSSIEPANNAVGVSLITPVTVTFTQALDTSTITAQSFKVSIGGNAVAGAFSFSGGNTTVRFTPTQALPTEAVVVTELSSAIENRFGDALVAADGSLLTSPLLFTFLTGSFSITSPSGAQVVENSQLLLEARGSGSLGIASVVFTVNGQAQPAVSGPPFTSTFAVGSAASTPTLLVTASGRNGSGIEIVHDERTFTVVAGLTVTPTFTGIPLGGTATLRYSVSSAQAVDLPITLSAGDGTLVTFPVNPVVLPAGQTSVDGAVAGVATGATAVLGTSDHGTAVTIAAVSPLQSGQTLTPFSAPIGASISNPPSAGTVILQAGADGNVPVSMFSAPLGDDAAVSIVSTNNLVAVATASTIAAGQLTTQLHVTALADGVATLILRAGGQVRAVTVFVGVPPPGTTPLILASPVGLSISSPPNAGQIVAAAGRQLTITVQALSVPAAVDTPVTVSTDNAGVATATAGVVHAGETSVVIAVTTVADGVTRLTIRAGTDVRALTIFVGTPPAGSTPILFASPVGVSLSGLPTLGRLFVPSVAVRSLSVRLFDSPVASETPVAVTTSDATIASVASGVSVHAGEQVAALQITTGVAGMATLTVEAAGMRRELTIVVGSDPTAGTTPPVVAAPVGVTVLPNASIGRVFGRLGVAATPTFGLPLLGTSVGADTPVSVSSSNPAVASFGGSPSISTAIVAGSRVLQLPVTLSGTEGAALLTFEFAGQRRELLVVVGNPPASEIPAVTAPVVGVQVGP